MPVLSHLMHHACVVPNAQVATSATVDCMPDTTGGSGCDMQKEATKQPLGVLCVQGTRKAYALCAPERAHKAVRFSFFCLPVCPSPVPTQVSSARSPRLEVIHAILLGEPFGDQLSRALVHGAIGMELGLEHPVSVDEFDARWLL